MSRVSLFLLPFLVLSCSVFVSAATSCQSSSTTICVYHNGTAFGFVGGISNHKTITVLTYQPDLVVLAGWSYKFTLTDSGNFITHPFVLTSNDTGGCQNTCGLPEEGTVTISGDSNPQVSSAALQATASGVTLTYTSPSTAAGNELYYESSLQPNQGGEILIVDPTTYTVDGVLQSNSTGTGGSSGGAGATGSAAGTGTTSNSTTQSSTAGNTGGTSGTTTGTVSASSTAAASTGGTTATTGTGTGTANPNGSMKGSNVSWLFGGVASLVVSFAMAAL